MSASQQDLAAPQADHRLPTTFQGYLRSFGPGLVLAMTFLGTGDLVASTVAGANYGYDLLWTLVIALLARGFMISYIAKYTLMNRFGDTDIIQGYKRVWRGFPLFFGILIALVAFVVQMSFLRAGAVGLYQLFNQTGGETWGVFLWSVVIVVVTLLMMVTRNQYRHLETLARIASVIMIGSFLYALFKVGHFDVTGFFRGLTFGLPENAGPFFAVFIAVSTIGAIGGSTSNLLYPGFMRDKGWVGPRYRKLQQLDLLFGMLPMLIINVLFWSVAAEAVHGSGNTIADENDLSRMMASVVGPAGPTLLWTCIFLASFTSFPSQARGFCSLIFSCVHHASDLNRRYAAPDDNPWFKRIQIGVYIVLPIIVTFPGAPDLVMLNVLGTSVATSLVLPPLLVGLVIMTSRKRFMMAGCANRLWEQAILGIISLIGIWSTFEIVRNFFRQALHLI
ncbi:Nramp family divalent metal transporter [Pantoea sp.]|uniref:Nramp family divalent metal transporter n=1 Tax=Pantoea sp. TaxID=69393 RepID=UPI00289CA78C|nr:Nramp family divalent metal transporter [Pantoea sp.]